MSIQGVSQCFKCKKAFDLFNRRHHCRSCGRIFCRCPRVPPPPPASLSVKPSEYVCVCVSVRAVAVPWEHGSVWMSAPRLVCTEGSKACMFEATKEARHVCHQGMYAIY
jgi:hypothetical protein